MSKKLYDQDKIKIPTKIGYVIIVSISVVITIGLISLLYDSIFKNKKFTKDLTPIKLGVDSMLKSQDLPGGSNLNCVALKRGEAFGNAVKRLNNQNGTHHSWEQVLQGMNLIKGDEKSLKPGAEICVPTHSKTPNKKDANRLDQTIENHFKNEENLEKLKHLISCIKITSNKFEIDISQHQEIRRKIQGLNNYIDITLELLIRNGKSLSSCTSDIHSRLNSMISKNKNSQKGQRFVNEVNLCLSKKY